jgi:hypothetical protein
VTDATGAFVRDLDRICEHRVDDRFEWSPDPASRHPFVFLRRGTTAAENASVIRNALTAAGIDPDSTRAQVMVRTNETRVELSRAWYELGPAGLATGWQYAEHEFAAGGRVMFLRNANREYKPRGGSQFVSSRVMNGTCGTIVDIFDDDSERPEDPPVHVADTRVRRALPSFRRWLRVSPCDLTVLLDDYGKQKIARVPPVTIDKMQGLEVDYSVVLLVKPVRKIGAKGMYSACSRGKLGCFVVADFDGSVDPASGVCPSHDFAATVMASQGVEPKTDFWTRFPEYDDALRAALAVDPERCIYYTKKKKKKSGEPAKKRRKQ